MDRPDFQLEADDSHTPYRRDGDEEIQALRKAFDRHILDEEAWRMKQDARWEKQDELWEKVADRLEALAEGQNKNTADLATLIQETRDVVQLTKDLQGIGRVGTGIQRVAFWLAKWGVVVGILGTGMHWILNHTPHK